MTTPTDDEIYRIWDEYVDYLDTLGFARRMFALGAAAEREACAKVCEKLAWGIEVTDAFAAAIRARSEP